MLKWGEGTANCANFANFKNKGSGEWDGCMLKWLKWGKPQVVSICFDVFSVFVFQFFSVFTTGGGDDEGSIGYIGGKW